MINDGIASIINKRLKHSENRRQTRASESAQRIWCVDVAGKLECEWYLRHPVEGIGHSKGEARIAKPALKIAGIMIVAWLRLCVDIGLVGIISFHWAHRRRTQSKTATMWPSRLLDCAR